jgi:hypothetical protein
VGQFEKWHGRPAREITRKMRVPPQTDPLPEFFDPGEFADYVIGSSIAVRKIQSVEGL